MVAQAKLKKQSPDWHEQQEYALRDLAKLDLKYMFSDPALFKERWHSGFATPRRNLWLSFSWVVDEWRMMDYLNLPENKTPHLSTTEAHEQYLTQVTKGQQDNDLLFYEVMATDVSRTVKELRVPLFAFLGRHDTNVDSDLAEQYFRKLRAPFKRIVWFENSAHMMTFEEPALFQYLMTKVVPVVRD